MKWVNHQVVTGVIVYTATEDLLLTAYSMAGAILPDKVEGNPRAGSYWSWRSRHRGWSHWPLLYLMVIGGLFTVEREHLGTDGLWDMSTIAVYMMVGALLHIFEDALCGKVPFLLPSQKIGIRLFSVGSVREYLVSIGIVLAAYLLGQWLH